MSLIVLEVSSWTQVIYMNIFLLVVKDSTRKQTQKWMKGSQVGTGSFTAETCSPDVTDILSMRWYTYVVF